MVLEAMASGLPVVAVNSGGVTDNLVHNYNGFLCKPRDTRSFTQAVSALLDDRELTISLGMNAREYTLSKSWDSVFGKLIEDYSIYMDYCTANLPATIHSKGLAG